MRPFSLHPRALVLEPRLFFGDRLLAMSFYSGETIYDMLDPTVTRRAASNLVGVQALRRWKPSASVTPAS